MGNNLATERPDDRRILGLVRTIRHRPDALPDSSPPEDRFWRIPALAPTACISIMHREITCSQRIDVRAKDEPNANTEASQHFNVPVCLAVRYGLRSPLWPAEPHKFAATASSKTWKRSRVWSDHRLL